MPAVAEEGAPGEEEQPPLSCSPVGPEPSLAPAPTEGAEERAEEEATACPQHTSAEPPLDQFRIRKFFVLRPGTLSQAVRDVEALVDGAVDGSVRGVWLMAERDGEGVRVFWDRLREPSFTSRWNPFATDFPFVTFTHHPVRTVSNSFSDLCDIQKFQEQLRAAAQKVHAVKPVPGKANGVMVLNELIHIETYVGLMSFLGNQNKLGYCMARGNIGF